MANKIDIEMYAGALAPVVTATPDATGVTITIIDADGTHTAHVNNGVNGEPGAIGPQGPQGPQGVRGDTGLQGEVGPTGPQGPVGPAGQNGAPGQKGDTGEGFSVYKTYASIALMNADLANVPEGKFVMISSTVDDPDNAKLYVRGTTAFTFITDMSGAQGIQGPQGIPGQNGAPGIQGEIGPRGPRGYSVSNVRMDLVGGKQYLTFIFEDGTTKMVLPYYLPTVTTADVGKVLTVDADGNWIAANI